MDVNAIKLEGQIDDLDIIVEKIKDKFPDEIRSGDLEVKSPTAVKKNILDKSPYYQLELYEVLIGIGVNMVSTILYDSIKTAILEIKEKKKLNVKIKLNDADKKINK